jgi:Helix-turn-helix domain
MGGHDRRDQQQEEPAPVDNSAGSKEDLRLRHRKEWNLNTNSDSSTVAQGRNGFAIAMDAWLRPIKQDRNLPRNAYIVADEIARGGFNRKHFEVTGELLAWPSIERLVSATSLSRRTIIRLVTALVEAGYIAREVGRGRGNNNQYRALKKVADVAPFVAPEKVSNRARKGVIPRAEKVSHVAPDSLKGPPEGPFEGRDSPLPLSRVLSKSTQSPEATLKKDNPASNNVTKTRRSSEPPTAALDADFRIFWSTYPRRTGEHAARRAYEAAWRKIGPATILKGVRRYAAERDGEDPRFTKHPRTGSRRKLGTMSPSRGGVRNGDHYQTRATPSSMTSIRSRTMCEQG